MKSRRIFIIITTLLLIAGVAMGTLQSLNAQPALRTISTLENVRHYAPATQVDGLNFAVEGGVLFAGGPGAWTEVATPDNVIVATVAVDAAYPDRVYIGAANELAVYRTDNLGRNWQRAPLVETDLIPTGGVIALAVDPVQHLIYAGTDTAGLFRLRDVGSGMNLTAHLLTPEPVREIVVDAQGKGFLFARTDWALYRGENYGLAWTVVDEIRSAPTALAIGLTDDGALSPVVYVGTVDRGVVRSLDGFNWATANEGLNFVPGSRLYVNALATDPARPDTVYVATSYLSGSTTLHNSPSTVYMGTAAIDAAAWATLDEPLVASAAALLPVTGQPGAVYALTSLDRMPTALGSAVDMTALATAPEAAAESVAVAEAQTAPVNWTAILSWIVAGLAAAALVFSILTDVRRRPTPATRPQSPTGNLAQQTVSSKR